jgi:hypothetical protein
MFEATEPFDLARGAAVWNGILHTRISFVAILCFLLFDMLDGFGLSLYPLSIYAFFSPPLTRFDVPRRKKHVAALHIFTCTNMSSVCSHFPRVEYLLTLTPFFPDIAAGTLTKMLAGHVL